jgi:hypothetical protein
MIIRNLFSLLMISICSCLSAQNIVVNSGFEENSQDSDKPDYWRPRGSTLQYHHIENDSANVYSGSKCAKFNNTSATNQNCYYYSNYNISGTIPNFVDVDTEEVYEFSIKYRTDSAFSGAGINIQIFFCDGDTIIGNSNTEDWVTSSTWNTLKVRGKIRGITNKISVAVNYFGKGIAWVDDAQLVKIETPLCKNGSFETDNTAPADKADYWFPRSSTFQYHHIENSFLNAYSGYNAALFDNTGAVNACYYYGPYTADGYTSDWIPVCPGDSYSISGFGKVDSGFIGSGVKLSLIFWDGSNFISRVDSPYTNSTLWTRVNQNGTVPAGANLMSYSAEYYGQNKAWIDEVKVESKNLIKNSSFETDTASPVDKPDYWRPRGGIYTQYHHTETTIAYEGSQCVQFNNTSGTPVDCYFYGPANAASDVVKSIDVVPGATYTFSAWSKVDSTFSGTGLKISIIFFNDSTFVSRVDSAWMTSQDWTKQSVQAIVPASGVNRMWCSVEYSGCNKAWFDRTELYITPPWYYQDALIDSLENLSFTSPDKLSYSAMQDNFYSKNALLETEYNGDGSWGNGYGVVTNDYPDGHPLIRASAYAIIGYLSAFNKIDSSYQTIARNRSLEGLEWLLNQQNASGSFSWWNANPPTATGGPAMYEGGLAGAALIKGYEFFGDQRYLTASNNLCNYFVNSLSVPNANANFNAFAIRALVANYKHTGNQEYLNQALKYMNAILSFQLDSGMMADDHNQYIWYHGIITQSMVELLDVMPDSNSKKGVIRYALYKALNHIRRSQNHSTYSTVGVLLKHPIREGIWYCAHATMAVAEAYGILGMTSLSDSMDTLTQGTKWFVDDQGESFAAIGIMLYYYY